MAIGARTRKQPSITASSWRSGKGKATTDTLRACIAAAVPSLSTWYVRESSGGGIERPPALIRAVMIRTIHVCTLYALSLGSMFDSSCTSDSETPPITSKQLARANRLSVFLLPDMRIVPVM